MSTLKITLGDVKKIIRQGYARSRGSVTFDEKKDNFLHTKLGCTPDAVRAMFKAHPELVKLYNKVQRTAKFAESGIHTSIEITDDEVTIAGKERKDPAKKKKVSKPPSRTTKKTPPPEPEPEIEDEEEDIFADEIEDEEEDIFADEEEDQEDEEDGFDDFEDDDDEDDEDFDGLDDLLD